MKYLTVIFILILVSCIKKSNQHRHEKLGQCNFEIKDTISTIVIGYSETTESLDAEKRKGNLYYPPKIFNQIKKLKESGKTIPCGFDLYLTGERNLHAKLFDTILSPKTGSEYLVTGKVTGYKGYGTIFKIYSCKKI